MFWRTPPSILPTVTTAGSSVMSTWRLTIVCRPTTICDAATIGSTPDHGTRAVRLPAAHIDAERIGAGHERARTDSRSRRSECRHHMQAEDRLGLDGSRTTPSLSISGAPPSSPSGGTSSAGWKMNSTVPGSSLAHRDQRLGDAHQDRDVRIVAAGMHDADLLAEKLRGHRRLERHVDLLGHRQRVHVGAQCNRRARACRPSAPPSRR